jgi:hypothetical protein
MHEGAQISQKPPPDDVERFLSLLRFDSWEKSRCFGALCRCSNKKDLAILHIIWHLPLFGLEFDSPNILPWALGLLGFTIITTWIYTRAQGNLLLPALFHTSVNVASKYLFNS